MVPSSATCFPDRHTGYALHARLLVAALLGVFCFLLAGAEPAYNDIAATLTTQLTKDQDADTFKGKTLLITRFKNLATDEDVDPAVLQEKLITMMVKSKWCKVIERERLEELLKEIKTDDQGLTKAETRKQLGKLLGATFILVGTISGNAQQIEADARIDEIESGVMIVSANAPPGHAPPPEGGDSPRKPETDVVESHVGLVSYDSTEFVLSSDAKTEEQAKHDAVIWLVKEKILHGAADVLDTWHPEIAMKIFANADRFVSEVTPREDAYYLRMNYAQLLRDLVFIFFGKITPRIAVDTTEQIIHRPVPDPAVQTVIAGALNNYGFQVVDSEQAQKALKREVILQALTGDANAMQLVQNASAELHADIVALGESFAEERQRRDGFDARIEVRLVQCATARLLTSVSNTTSITADRTKQDATSNVVAKKALERAARGVVIRMCSEMLKSFGQPVYRLRVWKINNYGDRQRIQTALKDALPGAVVSSETFDARLAHCAIFSIRTKKDADAIAQALTTIPNGKLAITGIDCRSIVGELR